MPGPSDRLEAASTSLGAHARRRRSSMKLFEPEVRTRRVGRSPGSSLAKRAKLARAGSYRLNRKESTYRKTPRLHILHIKFSAVL